MGAENLRGIVLMLRLNPFFVCLPFWGVLPNGLS